MPHDDPDKLLILCLALAQGRLFETHRDCLKLKTILIESGFSKAIKQEALTADLASYNRNLTIEMLLDFFASLPNSSLEAAKDILEQAEKERVKVLCPFSIGYPERLLDIDDPPIALFIRGEIQSCNRVAIVGARRSTTYGNRAAFQIAERVVQSGLQVVSGLAFGIDSSAHLGALKACQRQGHSPGIAVLGSGVLEIYPRTNQRLAEDWLSAGGAVISEYGLKMSPRKHYFPRRNRLISALSDKVVVVEAAAKSGSLITARLALEQGREVFAVPGPIDSLLSDGTNDLLRQGAQILTKLEDICEKPKEGPTIEREPWSKSKLICEMDKTNGQKQLEQRIVELLSHEPQTFDQLISLTKATTKELSTSLSILEIQGILHNSDGSYYQIGEKIDA